MVEKKKERKGLVTCTYFTKWHVLLISFNKLFHSVYDLVKVDVPF